MFCAKLLGSQLEHAQKHRLPIKMASLLMSSPAYDRSGSLYGLFPIGPSFLSIAPSLAYRWTCIAMVASLNLGVSPSNYDLVSALNTRDYLGAHR